jgi:Tol biopolymer transport system component
LLKVLAVWPMASIGRNRVRKPLAGEWQRFGASFSPDGTRMALAIREESPPDGLAAAAAGRYLPRWTRLALIDVVTAEARLVQGRFDNFCTTPVWSPDGRWLLFNAPFDKSLFACDTHARPPVLQPFLRRRGRPSPLADITHSVARSS